MAGDPNRLAGHELRLEGAPHVRTRGRLLPARLGGGVGGVGLGACSCGAASPAVLTSGAARKAWHRDHKDAMRYAERQEQLRAAREQGVVL